MTGASTGRLSAALSDRYRIERELGEGGMATVYLARDLKHERDVAIKVLKPELAAVIGAERFLSEIHTMARLQHPNILPLLDSGEADGLLYYVMPFVEGETLRDRLGREKQLPVGDAVRIAAEVAGALDYAHRHGVIHRDIKPANILLQDDRALVADFGIALAASTAGDRITETGLTLGTPQYMAPEQAMGERDLDARTDVYALGSVLYEMLAGEPPFGGPSSQAVIARVVSEEPASLDRRRRAGGADHRRHHDRAVEPAVVGGRQPRPVPHTGRCLQRAIGRWRAETGGTGHAWSDHERRLGTEWRSNRVLRRRHPLYSRGRRRRSRPGAPRSSGHMHMGRGRHDRVRHR